MTILDLYAGAGIAARGFPKDAYVTAVDSNELPLRYHPAQAKITCTIDAHSLKQIINDTNPDFIWASPPCQSFTSHQTYNWDRKTREKKAKEAARSVAELRTILTDSGCPAVIENVPGAPIRADIRLSGQNFRSLAPHVKRPRIFEAINWVVPAGDPPSYSHLFKKCAVIRSKGAYFYVGKNKDGWDIEYGPDAQRINVEEMCKIWGLKDVVPMKYLSQGVPPAFAEYIFRQWKKITRR